MGMVIHVNILIYIYMALCACLLAFDLFYMGRSRHLRRNRQKRVEKYTTLILQLIRNPHTMKDERVRKRLVRKLGNMSRLTLFDEAASQLLADEEYSSQMRGWLSGNRDVILEVSRNIVEKKNNVEKAFIAYMIGKYRLCGTRDQDPFQLLMLKLLLEPSLYCRENALSALYASGQIKYVVRGYRLLAKHRIQHIPKLVTDGLLTFSGNHRELAEGLWEVWDEFPSEYQTAFINYMRMVTSDFSDRMLALIEDESQDKEVRLAAVRYFRRHRCEAAERPLQNLLFQWQKRDWEFAAVAALSLETYPGECTEWILSEGCRSTNWYIRDNSSDSLMKIAGRGAVKRIIDGEDDRYARQILQYKLNKGMDKNNDGCN